MTAIVNLAHGLGLDVTAEGVETLEHGRILLEIGCTHGQGYAIARPMPADAVANWVATWRPEPSWPTLKAIGRDDLPTVTAVITLVLVPGIGAQGGDIDATVASGAGRATPGGRHLPEILREIGMRDDQGNAVKGNLAGIEQEG